MIRGSDPVGEIRKRLISKLMADNGAAQLREDEAIDPAIRWSPHVRDDTAGVAWHILTDNVESGFWARRMTAVRDVRPDLRLGVALPEHLIFDEDLIKRLNDLNVRIALTDLEDERLEVKLANSAADIIYERGLKLSTPVAADILDKLLDRSYAATSTDEKGRTLELLTAVLLSQVDGFEVKTIGISNRSQQMDVVAHNRNTAGVLGRSEVVIAEAKNWKNPVGTTEYFSVYRKIETRFGRSRLGYFVTTDRFTGGVELGRLKDAKGRILVVPLDRQTLPKVWRNATEAAPITRQLEDATLAAALE
jgi:hypothetical protein